MIKVYLPIVLLALVSTHTRAAERTEATAPAITHGTNVCSNGEKWEHGQDLITAVPEATLTEFTASAKDRSAPLRGFSEGLRLKEEKNETARAFGEYWMGRGLFLADLHGPAIAQFNALIAMNPTPRTIPFQLAAMECLRSVHAKFPVPLLTNEAMANLPDYYKADLVPEKSRRPLHDMTVELVARRIAEKASPETVDKAISLLKGAGYFEDYARALWATNRKKLEGVTSALKHLADAKELPPTLEVRRNEIRLLLARAYYQDRKFKEASKYLDVIDKRSNAFVQALVLQTWVDLAANEHRRVVGTTLAFQSTGLRATFSPEPYMTGAMALNEFCLFPEALHTLSNFKRTFGPSFQWLGRENKANKGNLYPEAIAHLTKQATSVPPQIASEWIRSPLFLNNQRAINSSFQQEKAIPGLIKGAESYAAAEAVRLEALRRKVAMREATEIAKEAAKKSATADANAKDLAKKSVASDKAVVDANHDATKAAASAEAEAKRAAEAPALSQRLGDEAKVAAKRADDAKAALAAAENADAAAKASVLPSKVMANLADERASSAERFTRILELAASEAERQRSLAFLPLRNEEAKAKKFSADSEALGKKAEQAKLTLETTEREYEHVKALATKAREEANAAAQLLSDALKKSGGSDRTDAVWEKAWDKARADKTAAEERARRAELAYEALEKHVAANEVSVSRVNASAESSARSLAYHRARAMKAAGSFSFEKALEAIADVKAAEARATADAKLAAQANDSQRALKAEAEAGKGKFAEATTAIRDAEAAIEKLKSNATDTRSARKMAATTEASAKKSATVAQAAAGKAATARQAFTKLDRDAAASAKLAANAQANFMKLSESVRPAEKRAVDARTEASLAQSESRMQRVLADQAKARVQKMDGLIRSHSSLVIARNEENRKLTLAAQQAAKRAEEAKANIAIAAQTAKAATQKVTEAKEKVKASELAAVNAKKEAADAKEKATQTAHVSKELAKFAAAVQKAGGKAGAVERPQFATLEAPSSELTRLTELLKVTEVRQAQLQKSLAAWSQTLKGFKEGAAKHRERLMARIESAFKAMNDRMLKQLEAVAKNNDLVEAEIWHGAGKDLVWQNANPEYAAAIKDGKFQSRTPASDNTYDWGSSKVSRNGKREVWEDEVGNASAALVDNCSNKERYASLRKGK